MSSEMVLVEDRDYQEYKQQMALYQDYMHVTLSRVGYPGPDDGSVEERISRIFRSSFLLSNGVPLAQLLIQATGINILRSDLGDETVERGLAEVNPDPQDYYPPKRHAQLIGAGGHIDTNELDKRILSIWDVYQDVAYHTNDIDEVIETKELDAQDWSTFKRARNLRWDLVVLWSQVSGHDYDYLNTGRPDQVEESGKRKSIAKKYILDGFTTGSYDVDMVAFATRATLGYMMGAQGNFPQEWGVPFHRQNLLALAQRWESMNPDCGNFIPADISELLGHPALEDSTAGENWRLVVD